MAKLHELLAVHDSLDKQATKTRTELMATFSSKRHLFEEKRSTFTPNEEGAKPVTEAQSDIQTTVASELEWISQIIGKAMDAEYQIDEANTQARADIVDDEGMVILRNMPATTLLQLEKELEQVRALILSVPTLDPAKGFSLDGDRGKGIYRAREVHKNRTKKVNKVVVLYPHTDKHPAQVAQVTEDVNVGTIQEQEWSAMLTPALKADVMVRCENLIRWVKKARSRANEVEIEPRSFRIGAQVLDYVFAPTK